MMHFYKKIFFISVSLIFFVSISLPAVLSVFNNSTINFEKRGLAEKPNLPHNMVELRTFPAKFDAYYRDHMGLRTWLSSIYSKVLLSLSASPVDKVVIGKDDWLFYAGEHVMEDYKNSELFEEQALELWAEVLQTRQDVLAEQGIEYLFVIAPNKHTIYPEKIPDFIHKVGNISRYDQIVNYLSEHTTVNFIDLRESLLASKSKENLYWPNDTHWNRTGGAIAQLEIAKKIKELGVAINPIALEPDTWQESYSREMDLLLMLGTGEDVKRSGKTYSIESLPCAKQLVFDKEKKYDDLKVTNVITSTCSNGIGNALVFRDSFSTELVPFFANYFSKAKYVWSLPGTKEYEYFVEPGIEIVIEERVERSLRLVPHPSDKNLQLVRFENNYLAEKHINAGETVFDLADISNVELRTFQATISQNKPLTIKTDSWNPQLFLPKISFRHGETYMVHVKMESPVASVAQLYYQTDEIPKYHASQKVSKKVFKGSNDLYFEIAGIRSDSPLRLDPAKKEGEYQISSIEIRQM